MKSISRRDFLKGSLAATGLTIAVSINPFGTRLLSAKEVGQAVFAPTAFYEITPDNLVTVYIPNSEMGQGARTALAMIVADELEVEWSKIRVKQAPAADAYKSPVFGAQVTVGSASCRGFYEPLRKAGAAGRTVLRAAAAQKWNVTLDECEAVKGVVKHKKSGRTFTYGQLCKAAADIPVPQIPDLKKESEFRYIGKPMARLDIPEKVAGTGVYGLDVVVPNMLIAVLARPPQYGAKPGSYDEKAAMAVKGVQKVVSTPNGIAVIADSTYAALKGRDALKVQWGAGSHPDMNDASIEKHFMEGLDKQGATVPATKGDAKKALGEAAKKVEAVYYVPFVSHVPMEPLNCTAYVQDDRCDIWVPTQGQTGTLMTAAGLTKLPPTKINVNTTLLGCGFGRRSRSDWVIDAVSCSKAVGKPVKVVWTREEDIANHFFRAATAQKIEAGLDAQGNLVGWSHKVACSSILKFSNPAAIKNGVDHYSLWGIWEAGPPFQHFNVTAYSYPNYNLEQWLSDLPQPACPWRSVQNAPNAFIVECFTDEVARAAGKDPVDFRMPLLANEPRAQRVLKTVAEKGGWGKPMPKGKGRGIAQHKCFGTYTAMVVDVSVNEATGAIKVDKVVVAVDCGPVVNPAPAVVQIQGGILMALSTVYREVVRFEKGGVKTTNFDSYKLLKMSDVPEMEVHILKSTEKIGGIGELGVPALAPAVANAVFAATGARVRRLPLDPKAVLDAIKARGA